MTIDINLVDNGSALTIDLSPSTGGSTGQIKILLSGIWVAKPKKHMNGSWATKKQKWFDGTWHETNY